MKKYRWYIAKWSIDLDKIASSMMDSLFYHDSTFGYKIDRIRNNLIKGKYIEKREYQESIEDPFGNTSLVNRVIYDIIQFSISISKLNLEIIDPPRKLSGFLSSLSEINNHEAIISPIEINIETFIDVIKVNFKNFVVKYIKSNKLALPNGILGKLELKGEKDVREIFLNMTSNNLSSIDACGFNFLSKNGISYFEIYKNGTIKIFSKDREYILPFIRQAIEKSIETNL